MRRKLNNRGKRSVLSAKQIKVWSLRKKILLSMVGLLLVLGLSTVLITRTILLKVLKTEFQQKGLSSAKGLAANSVVDVLTQNIFRLKQLVENEKGLDKDIAYVFIIDSSGYILAHTFDKGFPVDLAPANRLMEGGAANIQMLNTQLGFRYDIAVPIFSEKSLLGQARLGILQNSIQKTINRINVIFISVTFIIIAVGILLSYRVSALITEPISRLVEATQSIRRGNFDIKLDLNSRDEIGLLTQTFNEMAAHLKEQIEEIKRLTTLEERNRIAIELHDTLAQNLTHLISGLELCEKLFQKDPARAYSEMAELKENSRCLLEEARQAIFELQTAGSQKGNIWLNQISDFIKNFQNRKNMPVKLDISTSITEIPLAKARMLSYIVKEAFSNIDRHSQAKNIEVVLSSNSMNKLNITIKDDGRGFDVEEALNTSPASGRFGLLGMKQRTFVIGGELYIDSKPGEGTKIFLCIPL